MIGYEEELKRVREQLSAQIRRERMSVLTTVALGMILGVLTVMGIDEYKRWRFQITDDVRERQHEECVYECETRGLEFLRKSDFSCRCFDPKHRVSLCMYGVGCDG
jgi:hypothetical protein